MARIPTEINITDTELLLCINRLRRAEDRQPIVHLPLPLSFLSPEQRYNIYTRYDSEYRIHLRDKQRFLDYKYQIILNKTEHKLHVHNKARVARQQPQLHFLPFKNIAQQDIKYYFPASRLVRPNQIFITDTDCKYITSVIQVTSGGVSQIRASHTFHLSVSFNEKPSVFDPPRCSSPEFFTPQGSIEHSSTSKSSELEPLLIKQETLPIVYTELKDIFEMSSPIKRKTPSPAKRSHESKDQGPLTPNKINYYQTSPTNKIQTQIASQIKNTTIEFSPSKLAHKLQVTNEMAYRNPQTQTSTDTVNTEHLVPRNLFGTPSPNDSPPKYDNTLRYPPHQDPYHTPPMAPLNAAFVNTGAIPKNIQPNLRFPSQINNDKDKMLEEANNAAQSLIQQNSELRNNMMMLRLQYDSLMLKHKQSPVESPKKSSPFPTPSPPKTPQFQPAKIPNIQFGDPRLSIFESPRPEEANKDVKALQNQIAELAKLFGTIKVKVDQTDQKIESTKLTDVEKSALTRLTKKATPEASTLIYALTKPTNIIPTSQTRNPQFLAILKGHAAIATLGTFDPEKHPHIDFRDIWDRILNYTKNYQIYEHEYVDLLMTVMKGSAATILNGMIREYQGNLTQIIEAIQDIYIPQHTIYDDVEELNKFKRLPNENIKSMMRRASMIVERLKPTCAEAAWPDRKYHLLLSLLKQLIDKKTFKHLHSKELEAASLGIQMDIHEVITTVALYEASHESIPRHETSLAYNINSLQVIKQPESLQSEIDNLKVQIASLLPKKPRLDNNVKPSGPYTNSNSSGSLKRPHPGSTKRFNDSQSSNHSQRESRPPFRHSQRRPDGKRDFKYQSSNDSNRSYSKVNKWLQSNSNSSNSNSSQRPILSTQKWRQNRSQSRDSRPQSQDSRQNTYPFSYKRSQSQSRNRQYQNGYGRYRSRERGRSSSRNRYGDKGQNYNKSFGRGTNTVTMTFYQCKLCPKTHLKGTPCNSNNQNN